MSEREPAIIRFDRRVSRDVSGCHLWTGRKDHDGYGIFKAEHPISGIYKKIKTHRWHWLYTHGPIPEGMICCHHCDVRHCVNLEHIYIGTPQMNTDDMMARGRQVIVRLPGELASRAILKDEQVLILRREYAAQPFNVSARARTLGVAQNALRLAICGGTFKHLPDATVTSRRTTRVVPDETARSLRVEYAEKPFNMAARARQMGVSSQVIGWIVRGRYYQDVS